MARNHVCFIVPPPILVQVIEEGSADARASAVRTLAISERVRERRAVTRRLVQHEPQAAAALLLPPVGAQRTVASAHFETDYDNAFWDGAQMVYGDGDGQMFKRGAFTGCLDVIAHELTHGVTQFTAGLRYRSQSGALNESCSDVFGSLVKQRSLGQTADQADWLIGEGIMGPQLPGAALRSLKAPGTAFQFDNQPAHMDHYVELPDDGDPQHDHGGVHINSGIPNHAFYLAATGLGGNAWEKAGSIWYTTLTTRLNENSDFQAAADATAEVSGKLFGAGGAEEQAVRAAWQQVGITAA